LQDRERQPLLRDVVGLVLNASDRPAISSQTKARSRHSLMAPVVYLVSGGKHMGFKSERTVRYSPLQIRASKPGPISDRAANPGGLLG
jgi:hypothetical protein